MHQGISNIVYALAKLGKAQHPALDFLLDEVLHRGADKFNAQDISDMVYALAKLGKARHPALDSLLGEVLRRGLDKFNEQGLGGSATWLQLWTGLGWPDIPCEGL